jgi:hypothetical protein
MVQTVTNIKLVVSFWAFSEGQEPRRQPTAQCADNFAMPTSDNRSDRGRLEGRSQWPVFVAQGPYA